MITGFKYINASRIDCNMSGALKYISCIDLNIAYMIAFLKILESRCHLSRIREKIVHFVKHFSSITIYGCIVIYFSGDVSILRPHPEVIM